MKKHFTKYPSNYVRASRGSGRRLGWGINFRSMHTAIHGIYWSPNKQTANALDRICRDLSSSDPDTYESAEIAFEDYAMANDVECIDEINFRDITSDDRYYVDGGYIQIINPVSYDIY